jgi:uncharacterized protein
MNGETIPAFLGRLPAAALLALIRVYRYLISPGVAVALGSNCRCRFTPTCSHYAAEAIRAHGALVGSWLALCRVVKCTPLHRGGLDPGPERFRRSLPYCIKITR